MCVLGCASARSAAEPVSSAAIEPTTGGELQPSWGARPGSAPAVAMASEAEAPAELVMAPSSARPTAHPATDQRTYAQASPGPGQPGVESPQVASDARSGPLLVYQAELHMAVYKVEGIQQQAIAASREHGGYLSEHTDRTRLILRVPAAHFDKVLARIEALGEVNHRFVRALDVTAQFRDLEVRLRNAEAVRDRLLKLLDKAPDVPQSLSVERELDRLAERIEQMKGQLKLMGDQIAFSTITINFSEKRSETIDNEFELPFPWLRTLGLQHLMSFR
jgi:hypothetical protein